MMILLFPIVLLMSFCTKNARFDFWSSNKSHVWGLLFPAITFINSFSFLHWKMIENIVITGFDGILKTLPSLIIFGLVFKLLISVVSKGLHTSFYGNTELNWCILGSKARMVMNDIGNKVEKGPHKDQREVASQVPSRGLSSAQHLGELCLSRCWFWSWNDDECQESPKCWFFLYTKNQHQPDEVLPTETLETPLSPDAPETKTFRKSQR